MLIDFSKTAWKSFRCPETELRLDIVLKCGQSFRWSKFDEDSFIGVLRGRVWLLRQGQKGGFEAINYKVTAEEQNEEENEAILRDYFQLDVSHIIK